MVSEKHMHLLRAEQYTSVEPLLPASGLVFPLISAVLRGVQSGSVFVDSLDEPGYAIVVNRFGFASEFIAQNQRSDLVCNLRSFLQHERIRGKYILWYAPSNESKKEILRLYSDSVRIRTRVKFHHPGLVPELTTDPEHGPNVSVIRIDRSNLDQVAEFNLEVGSRFWDSPSRFLEDGIGFLACLNDEPASICYSATLVDGLAEVDVATLERFRGKGLGLLVTRAFVKECMKSRICLSWDCFDYNVASRRLALSVGFVEAASYCFVSLNA